MDSANIPTYVPHEGTIRISGATECKKAAKCAMHHLSNRIGPIDFFYIGANAGQQAVKAMGIFRYMLESTTDGKTTIFFQPNRTMTKLEGQVDRIDAIYWRAYLLRTDNLAAFISYGPATRTN